MSLHRRNPKRDANEPQIIEALEKAGVTVYRISGEGVPDLLCCYRGRWVPLEVKSGKAKLTDAQAQTFMKTPFAIVRTAEQAFQQLGIKVR